jgi:glycosyltransferase involved in cell wall biosynthesis
MDDEMTKVTLVVPTYNKLPRLSLVVASLTRQTHPRDSWEVLIVDDGSIDGTSAYLARLDLPFALQCVPGSRSGRAAARNRGLERATGDVVVFIDDDVLLPPEFVAEHVAAQDREATVVHGKIVNLSALKFFQDPSKGIFYPELERLDRGASVLREACLTERDVVEDFDRKVRANDRVTALESIIEKVLTGKAVGPSWLGFTGGNVAAPRQWLVEAGGFDPSFGLDWGCEDLELGYRLALAGRPFRYCVECVNYHMAHYRFRFDAEQAKTSRYFADRHADPDVDVLIEFIAGTLNSRALLDRFRERRTAGASTEVHAAL